ncbi:sigma-70 family RNA polymerase sigma factor [Anaeromyxobacter dehalogenans]|uniref:RNA polymerase, sigma subunit, ECF family n=1 Tax=Anaeromyxobacter dehalogenans (strain 2CP-C) TaxID=290397 RepID=Q2INY6_ANADE|nr:sigma-70 family RNA polymerase sigma factor [Anaeromyxobacter dehalogenans]ABC80517.1 RNA polymerase, sigma subunit, ECF family [Anaeromyxobacter dehalogenans 2CP-C]
MTDAARDFEPHRADLVQVAYRMLGSVAEAEDVVQDAFLRWNGAARDGVESPRAFLIRTVTRLCLDRLSSARARREEYVGTWLPEPLVEPEGTGLAHDLSVALLVTLQRLSPLERAAFLLHDVFDMEFADVAGVLERSEAAVRQLASRARGHVRDARPRFRASDEEARRLADAFQAALTSGDVGTLSRLLAEDAVFYADGGGKRAAVLQPIEGRAAIVQFLEKIVKHPAFPGAKAYERAWINGMPGFVVHGPEGVETLAIEIGDGLVVGIYAVRNPDKLRHLS